MSQKDSLSKLKNFFRIEKNSSGKYKYLRRIQSFINDFVGAGSCREKTDADLVRELEGLIHPQVTMAQRCKTIRELCDSDKINRLEDVSI